MAANGGNNGLAFGVTPEMTAAYRDLIFDLSLNRQSRRGDPARLRNFDSVDRQRHGTGMSDAEIAAYLGLTEPQVRAIRMLEESRRFDVNEFRKLNDLGSGKRYRVEKYVSPEERFAISPQALRLRRAAAFDPVQTRSFIEAGLWRGETVGDWLRRAAAERPDQTAATHQGERISYGELYERSSRFACALLGLGLRKGDVCALQLPNVPDYLIAYYGMALAGIVTSPMHVVYRAQELKPMLEHSRAKTIIVSSADPAHVKEVADLLADSQLLEHLIVAGETNVDTLDFKELSTITEITAIHNPPAAADPLLLGFTSGTSANPKAVIATHQTALTTIRISAPLLGIEAADRILSVSAFTHLFGMMVVHWAVCRGCTLVLLPRFTPEAYIDVVREQQPHLIFAVPAHVAVCMKKGLFDRKNLATVRTAVISGASCAPELARDLESLLTGGRVLQMYGMSEAMLVSFSRRDDGEQVRFHSCGRPIPGQDIRVTSPEGEPLSPGEEGEIQVRGPAVLPAYFDNSDATEEAFDHGRWFRTGDLGRLDGEGNVSITGRLKDVVNRGGIKINPAEVEVAVDQHPAVMISAIVGAPDAVLGERLCCFVQLKPEHAITLDDLCEHLEQSGVPKRLWPERLEVIAEMPMTPTRKVMKHRLAPL